MIAPPEGAEAFVAFLIAIRFRSVGQSDIRSDWHTREECRSKDARRA